LIIVHLASLILSVLGGCRKPTKIHIGNG